MPTPHEIEAMRAALRQGVQVVAVPQLFETPTELARRAVELADIQDGHRVLEPSAGAGRLLRAIHEAARVEVVAIEIDRRLADRTGARCADFLACNGELGLFDRVVMNPPFKDAADVRHIRHALTHLRPGGRLVAICANGPRQREALMPLALEWIDLEPGTFRESGTNVNAALLVITAEGNEP